MERQCNIGTLSTYVMLALKLSMECEPEKKFHVHFPRVYNVFFGG